MPIASEKRGFNPVESPRRLANRLKLTRFDPPILARTKPQPFRLLVSATERSNSVARTLLRQRARVDNLRILLVDDVLIHSGYAGS
jgi:predicted amidophosphoribosyltransferase